MVGAMNIGEKIRSLRVAKLMTQSDLAGNQITRNMLSSIENGNAQPSLSTILYIAERLNVPAGFLLAEEGDEIVYQKMNNLSNIKRAYKAGDLTGCRGLCLSSCPEADDEIRLLLANCDLGIAKDAFWNGRVRLACRYFDEALLYAEETLYPMPHIRAEAAVYFRYMQRLSPTLYSDVMDEGETGEYACRDAFAVYVEALDSLDQGDCKAARSYDAQFSDGKAFFGEHLRIRLLMQEARYREAGEALSELLRGELPLNQIELYAVLSDLETCSKEIEDYKEAYRFSNERVQLLEALLKN